MSGWRRAKKIVISARIFLHIFTVGSNWPPAIVTDGVPQNARVFDIEYDYEKDQIVVFLECDDWPVLEEGEKIPNIYVGATLK